MDTHVIISAFITVALAVAGWLFRIYADKQREASEAHTHKLHELESENKEQAKAMHALDLRLTANEESLRATKNHVTSIKEDIATMRTEIREDLRSFMETITQRIDAIAAPHRRK